MAKKLTADQLKRLNEYMTLKANGGDTSAFDPREIADLSNRLNSQIKAKASKDKVKEGKQRQNAYKQYVPAGPPDLDNDGPDDDLDHDA